MQTTLDSEPATPPRPPVDQGDPSRTGTLWVGATGVAMLLAAAGVLTAVSWGDIGQTAKLGGLVTITLSMLFGGARLRPVIPLTGRAIFHLGALLIPLDMAAVAILADRTWQETLLLTSATAVASWYALARIDPSVVLRWAAHASMVPAAAGVAAMTPLATPLVLAAVALAAVLAGELASRSGTSLPSSPAILWAATAGALPLAAFFTWPTRLVAATGDLGFMPEDRWQLLAAGVFATTAAGWIASRQSTLEVGWLAVALATATGLTAGLGIEAAYAPHACAALLFVLFEFWLLTTRDAPVWAPLREVLGPLVEIAGAMLTAVTLVETIVRTDGPGTMLVLTAALTGLGWLTADRSRIAEPSDWLVSTIYGADWWPATGLLPASALGAALAIDAGITSASIALLAAGAWAVLTGRRHGHWVAAFAAWAALLVQTNDTSAVVFTGAAMALLTLAARLRLASGDGVSALLLAVGAALAGIVMIEPLTAVVGDPAVPIIAAAAWAMSWATTGRVDLPAAHGGRALAFVVLASVWTLDPWPALAATVVVAAMATADLLRSGERAFIVAAASALVLATVPCGVLIGFSFGQTGVLMAGMAMIAVGLMIVLPQWVELPLGIGAVVLGLLGLLQAAETAGTLAPALLLVGGAVVLFGAASRAAIVVGAGGVMVIAGTWLHLALWEVTWLEAYLAMPALVALWAGTHWHRTGVSSWIAFAPTIGLFGFVALADRFSGGSAWHAVIAAAVGIAAVIVGASQRLVGPLVTGTVLVAVAVLHESLGAGAQVPTWAWLALGGAVLLAAAVHLERRDTSPVEQGQRIVEILTTRYT